MKRWLPQPLMSATLFIVWLLLNVTIHPAHAVLGALLALALPVLLRSLAPVPPRIRRPGAIIRLGLVVLWDIVRANAEVARLVLGPESRIHPRFVWVPLTIRDEHGIAALAGIITMTPGTLSAELAPGATHLLVHAFNAVNEAALVAEIKSRYEAPLMEIF